MDHSSTLPVWPGTRPSWRFGHAGTPCGRDAGQGRAQGKGYDAPGILLPINGEDDEVVFHYAASRAYEHVPRLLGVGFTSTLLSDGYKTYARYAQENAR